MATMGIERPTDLKRQWYEYFDEELRDIGERATPPTLDQTPEDYCRQTCRSLKREHLPRGHRLRQVKYDSSLPDDALRNLVPQLVAAVKQEALNPANVPFGEFKAIQEFDNYGARRSLKFIGQNHFTKFMGRPGRKVVSFNTPQGPVDASGRYLR